MHGAVVVEVDFAPHKPVTEFARLDLQRLHIAGDLFIATLVHDFQNPVGGPAFGRMNQHDKVRRPGQRHRLWSRGGELHSGQVDPSGGPGDGSYVDFVDEYCSDYVHAPIVLRPSVQFGRHLSDGRWSPHEGQVSGAVVGSAGHELVGLDLGLVMANGKQVELVGDTDERPGRIVLTRIE